MLRKRGSDLYGIVNGINYHEYDPSSDPGSTGHTTAATSTENVKQACAPEELVEHLRRTPGGHGVQVGRPEGLDILLKAIPESSADGSSLCF